MKKFIKEWKWMILAGAAILVLGLILRLYNLDSIPIFADEAIYMRWAQVMRAEPTLRFLPLSDGKQPLFMWLVIPFLKVIKDPLFAGRVTSVFAGIGTLVGVFLTTYYLFKSYRLSLIASLLYALSPFAVFFDRMALVDSLLTMFGVWTFFLGVVTAKTLRLDFAMLTGFALGGALLTKSPGLFFVLLLPSTWLLSDWPKDRQKVFAHFIRLVFLLFVTYLLSFGIYNILRLGPNFHLISSRNQDYVLPLSHLWTNPKDPFIFHFDRTLEWVWALGPSVIWFLAPLGLLVNLKKNRKEVLVLALWYLFPVLVQSEFGKVFTARYILFSIPYFIILAATPFLTTNKFYRKILTAVLILFLLHAFKIDYLLLKNPEKADLPRSERSGYLEEWTAGTGIAEVSTYIRQEYQRNPQQKIVVGTEGFFGTLPDGLQIYLNDLKEITVIGVGIIIDQIPTSLTESKEAGNRTFLVVNSSRFKADPAAAGLKLIASYPKAERPIGFKEYVQFGPRDSLLFFELAN